MNVEVHTYPNGEVEYVYTIPQDELVERLASEVFDAVAAGYSINAILSGRFGPLDLVVGDYLDANTINYLHRNYDRISYNQFKDVVRDSIHLTKNEKESEEFTVVEVGGV